MRLTTKSRRGSMRVNVIVLVVMSLAVLALGSVWLVSRAREAARREQTFNNLRQLAVALHNSDQAVRRMPPAFGAFLRAPSASIHVHLLPYDDQGTLYESFLQGGAAALDAAGVVQYLSPADPTTFGGGPGQTNFAANIRVFSDTARRSGPDEGATILADDTMSFGLGNGFPDGTSHTIIFATRFSQGQSGDSQGTVRTLIKADPTSASGAFFGGHRPRVTAQANCPRGKECTFQNLPTEADAMMTPSHYGHSYAQSGLSACMADTVVRQVPAAMRIEIWQRLVHPDDGQKVNDSDWE